MSPQPPILRLLFFEKEEEEEEGEKMTCVKRDLSKGAQYRYPKLSSVDDFLGFYVT